MRRAVAILLPVLLLLSMARQTWAADTPAFDLTGPKVDVHVQRDGKTLPIAEVPSLRAGDRLWIHPDFPESQAAHFVLIVAFLRGVTNPPPPEWFKRVDTWNRSVRDEGVFVVVPPEAQQAIVFLAPETVGDFSTLRKAVHDRPGAFVRAGQDLQQASWDRMRLDAYLAEVKSDSADPRDLKERTALAARSLGIRVDQQCFDKPTEQQAPCLVQHTDGLVLDDSNAQSLVNQMANGSAADMMNQLSYAPLAGAGAFSPYVGALVDIARILSDLHTAKFQYIPALALPLRDTLNLRLNVPPSFRDPKSVIVVALPPVLAAAAAASHQTQNQPQMRPADPAQAYCAQKPGLALLAEGAPLVYATSLAYDLTLHIESGTTSLDIPLKPDPSQGGLVLEKPLPALPEPEVTGVLRGKWGFEDWEGPRFHLRAPGSGTWTVPTSDQNALMIGRDDLLHLQGTSTLCVSAVEAQPEARAAEKLAWKSPRPDQLEFVVPLKDAAPGTVTLRIHQYGLEKPDELTLQAYAEPAALERLTLSAGDHVALLRGKGLDAVSSADLAGITFAPVALNRVDGTDRLEMAATGITSTLEPASDYTARVTLKDGRQLRAPASVTPPRPQVDLLSKGEQHTESDTPSPVQLGSTDDLPLQARLVFFLRSRVPAAFPRKERIELAAVDGSFGTTLSLADGSLMLEDAHTAVAVIDPLARFGASAFGPLQLRAVSADGVTGDWVQLGSLVRVPGFPVSSALHCPRNPARPCSLTGTNLFLISELSTAEDMNNAVDVAPDFTGNALPVPNEFRSGATATLYLRLRDDPKAVQVLTLPVLASQSSAGSGGSSATPNLSPAEPIGPPAPAAAPPSVR